MHVVIVVNAQRFVKIPLSSLAVRHLFFVVVLLFFFLLSLLLLSFFFFLLG